MFENELHLKFWFEKKSLIRMNSIEWKTFCYEIQLECLWFKWM